ncbi:AAA family ATPase, partial [Bacteroides xylanisolvens]
MFNKMKYFFYPERRFVTFAPIMSNNPKSPIIDLQQQQLLLRMEYEYEKEEFKRQTETMGVARKVKRGLCWYPVSLGRSYYNSLNQLVIDITRTENKEIEHSFEFGRPVCFFHQSFEGKVKYMDFIATVSFADEERMVVVLPGAGALAELQTDGILGVQLYFDETSYRAMFEALEDTIRAKDNRLAELRDILLGTQKPGFRELYPVRFPWLNSTQETAVNKVLCTRDVSIVHGPPGTGKTTTLVEAIYETLHREPQVLVCAQSNTAVDWICEKLVDRGVPVLRIGNPTRVNDKMLSSTYERRFESHPAYPELWGIRKSIREMGSRMRRGSYSEREGMRNRMSRLRERATELEIQINADLFDSARVIASTLVSSNHRLLNGRRFPTLFIDEAAQALEAACWIAIRKADRVILAGDHCQLPPTIKCIEASRGGLDHTLM